MEEYKKYEKVVTRRLWAHSPTPETHNTLCEIPECHSNCHVGCHLEFSLDPKSLLYCGIMDDDDDGTCDKCEHSYKDHCHYRSLWEQQAETKTVVDEESKQKFFAARAGEGQAEEMMIRLERAIKRLDDDVKKALEQIALHTKSYVNLALTGSFVGLIKRTVRLLETTSEAMKNNEANMASVGVVEESLKSVKAKLALVTNLGK